MAWMLDAFVVAIILLCIIFSVRRGFVRTAVEVVGLFLSFYLAFAAAGVIASAVFDHFIAPAMVQKTVSAVQQNTQSSAVLTAESIWNALPQTVTKVAGNFGVTAQSVAGKVGGSFSAANLQPVAEQAVQAAARPVVVPLLRAVAGGVLTLILMVFVKILARLLGRVARLPVLRQVDAVLGIILGLVKGLLIAGILCIIISVAVNLTVNGFWCFTRENIEASVLFRFLAQLNPFNR